MAADDLEGLLVRCSLGDRAAFRALYDQAAPKLFGVALRILGDRGDAEDALQEAMVKAWNSAGRFQPARGTASAWLVSIARNTAIDRLRARRAPARDIDAMHDLPDPAPSPESDALASDERRRIEACLGRLAPDRARAVRLAYIEGYTYDDLARRFDVPLNTIRTWLRRALIALRECLEP
jgi:RNA polymerase sigma-70 factor, ECF subfamily